MMNSKLINCLTSHSICVLEGSSPHTGIVHDAFVSTDSQVDASAQEHPFVKGQKIKSECTSREYRIVFPFAGMQDAGMPLHSRYPVSVLSIWRGKVS